jgi:alpha-aminoadipate/glutamate carrier protein LysW
MISCPECQADIDVEEDELDEGESILCEECGRNFVVTSVDPLEFEPEEDEDFEEDEFAEDLEEEGEEEEEEEESDEEEDGWR